MAQTGEREHVKLDQILLGAPVVGQKRAAGTDAGAVDQQVDLPVAFFDAMAAYKAKLVAELPKVASRKASEMALEVITAAVPEMIGGSADLTGSNLTNTKSTPNLRFDETGAVVENPDLTLGYLTASTEEITHPAVEGVEEQWHWETVTEYPNGGMDVQRVVDVLGVQAQEEWVEKVPIQRYIRYTAEELAAQEEARKKAEALEKLPDTVAALQKENEMLKQCLLEMSEIVYA